MRTANVRIPGAVDAGAERRAVGELLGELAERAWDLDAGARSETAARAAGVGDEDWVRQLPGGGPRDQIGERRDPDPAREPAD